MLTFFTRFISKPASGKARLTTLGGWSIKGAWKKARAGDPQGCQRHPIMPVRIPQHGLSRDDALTKLGGCSSEGARRTVLHSSSMESISDDGKLSSHSSLCSTPVALACSGNTGILDRIA